MHALLLTPFYPPDLSGAGHYLADLVDGLATAGHAVTVLHVGGRDYRTEHAGHVQIRPVRSRVRHTTLMVAVPHALALHLRRPIDVVVAGPAHPTGTAARWIGTLTRRPLVVVAFGEEVADTSRSARRFLPSTLRRSRHVIAASSDTRRRVLGFGIPPARCSVVHPTIDPAPFIAIDPNERDRIRRAHGLEGRRVVVTVARLEARKGHDVVIDAIDRLGPDFRDVHYLVIGQGEQSRIRAAAANHNMADRFTIIDDLPHDRVQEGYAAGDVFAMLSRPGPRNEVEGFGIVYLEAAAAGLACVAGNLGGCQDAVAHNETGLCVDPRDPTAVADALRTVLGSPNLARRFGENGRQRVLAEFTHSSAQLGGATAIVAAAAG